MSTLRYAAEVRPAAAYFEDLAPPQLASDQLALARQLIENKTAQLTQPLTPTIIKALSRA